MPDIDALIEAAAKDDVNTARAMLERDRALVGGRDEAGATALHHAAFNGSRRVVRLLVERGADINARDAEFGATPAGWAIEYLRELGAHLAIELEDLAYAINNRDVVWVRRFLYRFPSLRDASYRDGTSFRELAVRSGDASIVELFNRQRAEGT
jgi:ankyrin repeat protein